MKQITLIQYNTGIPTLEEREQILNDIKNKFEDKPFLISFNKSKEYETIIKVLKNNTIVFHFNNGVPSITEQSLIYDFITNFLKSNEILNPFEIHYNKSDEEEDNLLYSESLINIPEIA